MCWFFKDYQLCGITESQIVNYHLLEVRKKCLTIQLSDLINLYLCIVKSYLVDTPSSHHMPIGTISHSLPEYQKRITFQWCFQDNKEINHSYITYFSSVVLRSLTTFLFFFFLVIIYLRQPEHTLSMMRLFGRSCMIMAVLFLTPLETVKINEQERGLILCKNSLSYAKYYVKYNIISWLNVN